ncbi:MAG: hypothetical protein OJF49_004557 [Ktedonobacterales bacterium]|nr:MAG: hypothetical protein OJF49_004557 [Ktedonobacterales bacterium]
MASMASLRLSAGSSHILLVKLEYVFYNCHQARGGTHIRQGSGGGWASDVVMW